MMTAIEPDTLPFVAPCRELSAGAALMMSVFRPVDAFPDWRDLIPYFGIGSVVGALFSAIVFAAPASPRGN